MQGTHTGAGEAFGAGRLEDFDHSEIAAGVKV
jgi:hypothetical protein